MTQTWNPPVSGSTTMPSNEYFAGDPTGGASNLHRHEPQTLEQRIVALEAAVGILGKRLEATNDHAQGRIDAIESAVAQPHARLNALEKAVLALIDALQRKDTEQDGNYGHLSFYAELKQLSAALAERN